MAAPPGAMEALLKRIADLEAERDQARRQEEEALEAARHSLPTTLPIFLQNCHQLSLAMRIVTDPTLTTQGPAAKPTNRLYPQRMTLWDDFYQGQRNFWAMLDHPRVLDLQFPSLIEVNHIRQFITPISSEMDLRYFERSTVENYVRFILDAIFEHEELRSVFGLKGSITFESHTNLLTEEQTRSLSNRSGYMSAPSRSDPHEQVTPPPKRRKRALQGAIEAGDSAPGSVPRGQADRYCIYKKDGSDHIPVLAIEYKAPHKLTISEIEVGLETEIQPARDVIHKTIDDDPISVTRRLVAAVITQLFSYMITKSVRYGYVCTGEAFIFIYIEDDPSVAKCKICAPIPDVDDDANRNMQYTAISQVLAFTLQALAAPPSSQEWHNATTKLDTWDIEYNELLESISPEARKKAKRASPGYYRSVGDLPPFHMALRNRDRSPSPSPQGNPHTTRGEQVTRQGGNSSGGETQPGSTRTDSPHGQQRLPNPTSVNIRDRPFCSQQCLLSLKASGPLDPLCPNFKDHRAKNIPSRNLINLVRAQLATDRGIDADCCPMYKRGSRGALFKFRLSSHGYVFVAKGMRLKHFRALRHENKVYAKLGDLQGVHVPVCLGLVDLVPEYPYYYEGGQYTHMLLLGWAGKPIAEYFKQNHITSIIQSVSRALNAIHTKHVLHMDAEPRNFLWDENSGRVNIVDFERSTIRSPLSNASPSSSQNIQRKKRVHSSISDENANDLYAQEEAKAQKLLEYYTL